MKIQRIKNLQGTEKFGTCIECGKDSYNDRDLVRIQLGSIHTMSACLCDKCLNRLIGNLEIISSE